MLLKLTPQLSFAADNTAVVAAANTELVWSVKPDLSFGEQLRDLAHTLGVILPPTLKTLFSLSQLGISLVRSSTGTHIRTQQSPIDAGLADGDMLEVHSARVVSLVTFGYVPSKVIVNQPFTISVAQLDANSEVVVTHDFGRAPPLSVSIEADTPHVLHGTLVKSIPRDQAHVAFDDLVISQQPENNKVVLTIRADGMTDVRVGIEVSTPATVGTLQSAALPPAPQLSPEPGTYVIGSRIELTLLPPATVAYYTLDGTLPTPLTGTAYTRPIALNSPGPYTLRCITCAASGDASAVREGHYLVTPHPPNTPTLLPMSGTFSIPLEVVMTCSTPGVALYYTVDGTTPTESSLPYVPPVLLKHPGDVTVNVVARRHGIMSPVQTAHYTLKEVSEPRVVTTRTAGTSTESGAGNTERMWTEYPSKVELRAREAARAMMADYLAAEHIQSELTTDVSVLEEHIEDLTREESALAAKIKDVEETLEKKNDRHAELTAWLTSHECAAKIALESETLELKQKNQILNDELTMYNADADEAQQEYTTLFAKLREARAMRDTHVSNLKEAFISQGIELERCRKYSQDDLEIIREAVAEQLFEIATLRSTLRDIDIGVYKTYEENVSGCGAALGEVSTAVERQAQAAAEAIQTTHDVLLPPGMLLKLNKSTGTVSSAGVAGNGIQQMRLNYCVDIEVVSSSGSGKILRIHGKVRDVEACVKEIESRMAMAATATASSWSVSPSPRRI
eukprot:PhM_4_TR18704/c0_g1_i2/m.7944